MEDGTYAYTVSIKTSPGDVFSQDRYYITPNPDATFCIRDYGDGECVGYS